jgi:hypothetical protein
MELQEAVQALSEFPKDDLSAALQEHRHELWQHIHDVGFSLARKQAEGKLAETQTKPEQAEATAAEKDKRIEEIEAKQPDLESERAAHKAAVDKLEAKHAEAEATLQQRIDASNRRNVLNELTLELKSLNPVYAEVAAERAMKRVQFKDDGSGDYDVMQETQIPFVTANGKTPIQLLAAEIVDSAPPELVVSNVDRGTGADNGTQSTGSPLYKEMREKAKEGTESEQARLGKIDSMFSPKGG